MGSIQRRHRRRAARIADMESAIEPNDELDGALLDEAVAALLDMGAHLTEIDDPFEAECIGAGTLVALLSLDAFQELGFAHQLIAALAATGGPEGLAVLVLMAENGIDDQAALAEEHARILIESGVPAPTWLAAFADRVEAAEFHRYSPAEEPTQAVVTAVFTRAGVRHGFLITVDYTDCGAVDHIDPMPSQTIDEITAAVRAQVAQAPVDWIEERLTPEATQRFCAGAIAAKLEHLEEDGPDDLDLDLDPDLDLDDPEDGDDQLDEDQMIGLSVLLGRRFAAAGFVSDPVEHGSHVPADARTAELSMEQMMRAVTGRPASTPLPPPVERTGPAAIYRLRIDIKDAKPPIWRRLEVTGDTSLAELHRLIQIAFDWDDSHLHRFDTPYGDFGDIAMEPAFGDEHEVDIEQVLHGPGDKLTYTYDFGDDWEHTVKVERTAPPEPGVDYPRCLKVKLAAPPEDCGGLWRYEWLRESLADTSQPEYLTAVDAVGGAANVEYYRTVEPDAAELDQALRAPRPA